MRTGLEREEPVHVRVNGEVLSMLVSGLGFRGRNGRVVGWVLM